MAVGVWNECGLTALRQLVPGRTRFRKARPLDVVPAQIVPGRIVEKIGRDIERPSAPYRDQKKLTEEEMGVERTQDLDLAGAYLSYLVPGGLRPESNRICRGRQI